MGWKPCLKAVCLVHLGRGKYDRHRCILSLIKHICVLAFKSWGRGQEAQPATRGRGAIALKPVSFSSASPTLSDLVHVHRKLHRLVDGLLAAQSIWSDQSL